MKRYVSLAGAMLVGTVVAQEKKAAFKEEVAAVNVQAAVQLKGAAAVPILEAPKPRYRSDVSRYTPDVERRDSPITENTFNSPNVERFTSAFTNNTPNVERITSAFTNNSNNSPNVEGKTSVDTDKSSDVERFTDVRSYIPTSTYDVEFDRFSSVKPYYTPDVEFDRFTSAYTVKNKRFDWTPSPDVRYDWTPSPDVRYDWTPSPDVRYDWTPSPDVRFDFSPATDRSFGVKRDPHHPRDIIVKRDPHHPRDIIVKHKKHERHVRKPKDVAPRHRRHESFYSARSHFDEVDEIMVKIERGFAGNCGTRYAFNVGDTYWCDDHQYGLRTHCQVVSSALHLCCVDTDGCNDLDDMRPWRF